MFVSNRSTARETQQGIRIRIYFGTKLSLQGKIFRIADEAYVVDVYHSYTFIVCFASFLVRGCEN